MTHISYSELKNWWTCPHKHKLIHIDEIDGFQGNQYTAFGTALHDVCESMLLDPKVEKEAVKLFESNFFDQIKSLKDKDISFDKDMAKDMYIQGKDIIPEIMPAVEDYFEEYEVFSTEEKIYEDIEDIEGDYKFKGYIDLVIKTSDNKYHIIDWKTCSWGWNAKKRADPQITYQLTFYKHFFAKKHGIDPNMIETHFALLKRTAKKNRVEIFRVTSGNIKTKNALNILYKAIHNISKKVFVKNRLSCKYCEFYGTKHCT